MATLFISDLHLCNDRPEKLDLFYRLISGPARQADALYILGDLFEIWLGDDDATPPIPEVLASLASLQNSGTPLYIMHGNRDFLMGSRFETESGCKLLPDPSVTNLYGVDTLLMHGDLLCTRDVEYQNFRRKVRTPRWQRNALRAPLFLRKAVGKQMRRRSMKSMQGKTPEIMDVDQDAVEAAMMKHDVIRLIHGHTHRPAIHEFSINGHTVERVVLGDWYVKDSVLVVDEDNRQLMRIADCLALHASAAT